MICKKCDSEIPEDSLYCNYCGKKLPKPKSKKSIFLSIFLILVFVIGIGTSIYFIITKGHLGKLQTFLENPPSKNKIISEEPDNESPIVFNTPEIKKETIIRTGFSSTEFYDDDYIYFLDKKDRLIYQLNRENDSIKSMTENTYDNFFVSNNIIYMLKNDGIYTNGNNENKIIHETGLKNFYIDEDFIFYTIRNTDFTYNLYRTELSGENKITILENINTYDIDPKDKVIYYTKKVLSKDYDDKNHYGKYIILDGEKSDDSDYMTLFSCDLAGEANLKIAETEISTNDNINFSNFSFLDDKILFNIDDDKMSNLCVLWLNKTDYKVIENITHYYLYNEEVFYTRPLEETPYLYGVYKYNFPLDEELQITETVDYNSIKIENNKIYFLIDNHLLMVCDITGVNKQGFFDYSIYDTKSLGSISKIDSEYIYFTNALLNIDKSKIIYFSSVKEVYEIQESIQYRIDSSQIESYFSFLTKKDNITKGLVFGLTNTNDFKSPELLVGERNNSIINNKSYDNIKNTKIYFYTDSVVQLNISDDNALSEETTIKEDIKNKRLVGYSNSKDSTIINYYEFVDGKIETTPILKTEFINNKNIYYLYKDDKYEEINYQLFFQMQKELDENSAPVDKYDVNISGIIKGLYFNSNYY